MQSVHSNAPQAGQPAQSDAGGAATSLTGEIRSIQGYVIHVLRNDRIELTVAPDLGAKIISLKDVRTGRDWMWHPRSGLKLFSNRPGDDFSRSPLVGMDECLPTIAPCVWRGRNLPDHGEAWSRPWQVDDDAWAAGVLKTTVRMAISPLEFDRTIELRENEVHLTYRLKNLSSVEEHYLWALHPLLRLEPGDQLELPACARSLASMGNWNGPLESAAAEGTCVKTFAHPLQESWAAVKNEASGNRLAFIWDAAENNTLGLWLTRGGWHGHHHFAIEPMNAADDSLAVAVAGNQGGRITGHGSVTWRICLRVGI